MEIGLLVFIVAVVIGTAFQSRELARLGRRVGDLERWADRQHEWRETVEAQLGSGDGTGVDSADAGG